MFDFSKKINFIVLMINFLSIANTVMDIYIWVKQEIMMWN